MCFALMQASQSQALQGHIDSGHLCASKPNESNATSNNEHPDHQQESPQTPTHQFINTPRSPVAASPVSWASDVGPSPSEPKITTKLKPDISTCHSSPWHAAGGTCKGAEVPHLCHTTVTCFAASADGQTLACAGNDGKLYIWTTRGEHVHTLAGHRGAIHAVC